MINSEKPEVTRVPFCEGEETGDARPGVCERLDSWKEIACYLRRSIRCVQRWEKREGLPILRHLHAKGSSVYAFRQELDRWWNGRENVPSDSQIGAKEKARFFGMAERRLRRHSRRIVACCVVGTGPMVARRFIRQRPVWRRSWMRG
jgi:hypothetical protein